MPAKAPEKNGTTPPQQQQIGVDPNAVINQLMQRIQQLTMELAVKDAYIAQLQAQKEESPSG